MLFWKMLIKYFYTFLSLNLISWIKKKQISSLILRILRANRDHIKLLSINKSALKTLRPTHMRFLCSISTKLLIILLLISLVSGWSSGVSSAVRIARQATPNLDVSFTGLGSGVGLRVAKQDMPYITWPIDLLSSTSWWNSVKSTLVVVMNVFQNYWDESHPAQVLQLWFWPFLETQF